MKHGIRRSRGQALVEFALVGPILAVLLVGLIDFGFLFYAHVQVINATREAARAGSVYLGGRFQYTSCSTGMSCPPNYGAGTSTPDTCWPMKDWVENALVERSRGSNGCVATGFNYSSTTPSSSFGILNPAHCDPATPAQKNCWLLESLTSGTTNLMSGGTPTAGSELRAQVLYRYELFFLSGLTGFTSDPIEISKTVVMRVQNK